MTPVQWAGVVRAARPSLRGFIAARATSGVEPAAASAVDGSKRIAQPLCPPIADVYR